MLTALEEETHKMVFASKGILGRCPTCNELLITKCGKITIPHFAHKAHTDCGKKYHDSMSEWHYNWQLKIENPTPGINIEVPIKQEYLKRADVITKEGVIIEFQKSPLPIDERILREDQYKNMIWVVHKDIEKSKTWSYHKSDTPILIDDPKRDYLYPYNEPNITISKKSFVIAAMNGNVAYPNEFVKYIKYRRLSRAFNSRNNYLMEHKLNTYEECKMYYTFRYFNDNFNISNKNTLF